MNLATPGLRDAAKWWNPTSGRVFQDKRRTNPPGGRVPPFKMSSRWIFLFFIGLLGIASAAEPEMRLSAKKIRDEVHATVETQLNALREGNFEQAYEMASAGIKAQFDVRLFAGLIRRGYPVLLQANEADVGIVRDKNEESAQVRVTILDRQKRATVYNYSLVKEKAGWRITGVVLEQRQARGDT